MDYTNQLTNRSVDSVSVQSNSIAMHDNTPIKINDQFNIDTAIRAIKKNTDIANTTTTRSFGKDLDKKESSKLASTATDFRDFEKQFFHNAQPARLNLNNL